MEWVGGLEGFHEHLLIHCLHFVLKFHVRGLERRGKVLLEVTVDLNNFRVHFLFILLTLVFDLSCDNWLLLQILLRAAVKILKWQINKTQILK